MKKIISLLLALIMLISLAVPAFADTWHSYDEKTGEHSEVFYFNCDHKDNTYYGMNINIESNSTFTGEVYAGGNKYTKIYVNEDKNFYITRVEARIKSYPYAYAGIEVNPGTKHDTEEEVTYDSIVCIDGINGAETNLSGGNSSVSFDKMVVYYKEGTPPTASAISEGNIWIAAAVGAAAVVAIAAVVIAKKKKRA